MPDSPNSLWLTGYPERPQSPPPKKKNAKSSAPKQKEKLKNPKPKAHFPTPKIPLFPRRSSPFAPPDLGSPSTLKNPLRPLRTPPVRWGNPSRPRTLFSNWAPERLVRWFWVWKIPAGRWKDDFGGIWLGGFWFFPWFCLRLKKVFPQKQTPFFPDVITRSTQNWATRRCSSATNPKTNLKEPPKFRNSEPRKS